MLEQRLAALEDRHAQELQQLQQLQSHTLSRLEAELSSATRNTTQLQRQHAVLLATLRHCNGSHQVPRPGQQEEAGPPRVKEIYGPPRDRAVGFRDCAQIFRSGVTESGVYSLQLSNSTRTVQCNCVERRPWGGRGGAQRQGTRGPYATPPPLSAWNTPMRLCVRRLYGAQEQNAKAERGLMFRSPSTPPPPALPVMAKEREGASKIALSRTQYVTFNECSRHSGAASRLRVDDLADGLFAVAVLPVALLCGHCAQSRSPVSSQVFCDMGFGDPAGEHWAGNDVIHHLTSAREYTLSVLLRDAEGNEARSLYQHFHIDGEAKNYSLHVSGFSGSAGRTSSLAQSGTPFSTKDRDNDRCRCKCAQLATGGWWFEACGPSNLNGVFYTGSSSVAHYNSIKWYYWKGPSMVAAMTTMMVRPLDF
ncbi:hypothetical protein JZ751_021930 [Albula glossodonta]|uniref:Fibrinogen C-terminal domain-containing protein n=1 Tax=Albula glossodonta TaxID=121402 RepID=A0A8T2MZG6_9TELE|nr:hypothetical protein JZ751_021930 [Albula glossodonta]